jgi:hypothetical protein
MAQPDHERVLDDHRKIKLLINKIEDTSDLSHLIPSLQELALLLTGHFEEEEAPEGFPQIIETAPHHARTLEHLFEEHKKILATLQHITTNALTCLHGPMAAVRRDVATLCETLRTHETTETELLTDSVYQDIGSGD